MTSPSRRRRASERPRRRVPATRPEAATALPPPRTPRIRPRLGGVTAWIVLLAGMWVGRAFQLLPASLEDVAGIALALASAVLIAIAYRRWARRQMERARARRAARAGGR